MSPFVPYLIMGCLIGLLVGLIVMRWILGWQTPREVSWHRQDLERLRLHGEASRALAQRLVYACTAIHREEPFREEQEHWQVGVIRVGHTIIVPAADQVVHPSPDWAQHVRDDLPGFVFRFERGSLILTSSETESPYFGSNALAFRLASPSWESGVHRFAQS